MYRISNRENVYVTLHNDFESYFTALDIDTCFPQVYVLVYTCMSDRLPLLSNKNKKMQ